MIVLVKMIGGDDEDAERMAMITIVIVMMVIKTILIKMMNSFYTRYGLHSSFLNLLLLAQ